MSMSLSGILIFVELEQGLGRVLSHVEPIGLYELGAAGKLDRLLFAERPHIQNSVVHRTPTLRGLHVIRSVSDFCPLGPCHNSRISYVVSGNGVKWRQARGLVTVFPFACQESSCFDVG
jgi:hypothetical protein